MERRSDYLKNRISIKQEIERIRDEIKQKRQRINFLETLLTNHTKELFIEPKVVMVVGEYAKDWIEENEIMFPKKRLVTHKEFEEVKETPRQIELIIILGHTKNSEEILTFAGTHRIDRDFLIIEEGKK